MRTIDLLYQAYVDERMESAESGEEQEAIRQFRNICSKADNSLMKLQGDIWDSMVQYGDSREKQGFIAGFMMACDLFRTGGTGSYDSKSYKCECGKETELVNLKPLYTKCKCGNEFKYMTNMNTAEFTYKCFTCGSPVDVKMNSRRTAYITIGGGY